jgi:signal transduction histidine kinase
VGQGGSITLEAYIHPEEDRVVCAFQDTGAGISQVDLPHIFDPFFRGDKARSAETGGAGLGLTIVKRIALLHGGSVYASNTAGKGARFEIHLPVSEQKPSEDVPALAEA